MATYKEMIDANNERIEEIRAELQDKFIGKGQLDITENGVHEVVGYEKANVNVQPKLLDKTFKENGTYKASDDGVDGYSSITIDVGGNIVVDLPIPDNITSVANFAYLNVDNDRILFSGYNAGSGLYMYTISSNKLEQLYPTGYAFYRFFQVAVNKWIICGNYSGSTNKQLLLYNQDTNTVDLLVGSYNTNSLIAGAEKIDETRYLLYSGNMFLYDSKDDSIIDFKKYNQIDQIQRVSETKVLLSHSTGYSFFLYNAIDNSLNEIYKSSVYGWTNFQQVTEDKWLIGSSNGTTDKGILLFNRLDDSISLVYEYGIYWQYFTQVSETEWLIAGSNSKSAGFLLYNSSNDTISIIYEENYYWQYYHRVSDNKWLIGSSRSSSGLLLYDNSNKTFQTIYSTGYNWRFFKQISNTRHLVSSSTQSSGCYGLLLYDETDDSVEYIYKNGYSFNVFEQVSENKWLIVSSKYTIGVLLFNNEDKSVVIIFTDGYYDTFIKQDNNYYIEHSDKNTGKYTVLYNLDDNTIRLVKYYLGEI